MQIFLRLTIIFLCVSCTACGSLSATTLRCGVDGESSYVEIVSAPQAISSNVRALSELCGFAYEGESNEA